MKVTLNITKTGIEKGIQADENNCPIARAMRAKRFTNVSVDGDYITGVKKGLFWQADTPLKANDFIGKFDNNKKSVKPFKLVINLDSD